MYKKFLLAEELSTNGGNEISANEWQLHNSDKSLYLEWKKIHFLKLPLIS